MMIDKLRTSIDYSQAKGGRTVVTLNDDNNFILKTRNEATEEGKHTSKKILGRLIEEGVDPRLRNMVKSQLNYWTENGKLPLDIGSIRGLSQNLNAAERKLENESYFTEIASYAKSDDVKKSMATIGINPDKDYELQSLKKRLDAISNMGVDVIPTPENHSIHIIRYINAIILSEQENDILNKIDLTVKQNPDLFLDELKSLKESGSYNPYVLDKLIAQAEVWKVMQGNSKLKNFPFNEIWRFCIDVEFQKFGAYIFENEPGYIVATLNALRFGLQLKNPTYLDYIEINRKCGENVLSLIDSSSSTPLRTHVMNNTRGIVYPISGLNTMDKEGLQDLKRENDFFSFSPQEGKSHVIPQPNTKHFQQMDFLFHHYNKLVTAANDDVGKHYIAIRWLTRELALNHHFEDGNYRSARILLESVLANNPYLRMILINTNPNLYGNGPIASLIRILQGTDNFTRTCGLEPTPLSPEEVNSITEVLKHPLWNDYHPTKEEREAFFQAHPLSEYEG